MKILHLSTGDINGGAAKAAYRLHKGLIKKGVDSVMFVRDRQTENEFVKKYSFPAGLKRNNYRFSKYLIDRDYKRYKETRPRGLETFSDDRSPLKTGLSEQLPEADIYHLHWISGFVDLSDFFKKITKPVVWTLHDMMPFTGGCHYNGDCEKFKSQCQACPQLGSKKADDLSNRIWKRKLKAYLNFRNSITVRADSDWLSGEAKKSSLFRGMDIDTIHYGIETDEFIARNRSACRAAFNIPDNFKIIAFGAPGVDNPRKGFNQLEEALKELGEQHKNLFLLTFGSGVIPENQDIPGLHLGFIGNNTLLSIVYNCADVFVIPSLQEAFGQTALEAMSCSVPVVGFDTGGIPDIIEQGKTGYLAQTGNTSALAQAINMVLEQDPAAYSDMADRCRTKVLENFTLSHQADKYINLYNDLINGKYL